MAKKFWQDPQSAIGKRFRFGSATDTSRRWMTIIGIVADTRRAGVDQSVRTESYQPYTQDPGSMTVLIRTAGEPTAIVPALRAVVRELDQEQPLARVASLDQTVDLSSDVV